MVTSKQNVVVVDGVPCIGAMYPSVCANDGGRSSSGRGRGSSNNETTNDDNNQGHLPILLCNDFDFRCTYRNLSESLWGLMSTAVILTVLMVIAMNDDDDDDDDGTRFAFTCPGPRRPPLPPSLSSTCICTCKRMTVLHRSDIGQKRIDIHTMGPRTPPTRSAGLREKVILRRFVRGLPTMPFIRI